MRVVGKGGIGSDYLVGLMVSFDYKFLIYKGSDLKIDVSGLFGAVNFTWASEIEVNF